MTGWGWLHCKVVKDLLRQIDHYAIDLETSRTGIVNTILHQAMQLQKMGVNLERLAQTFLDNERAIEELRITSRSEASKLDQVIYECTDIHQCEEHKQRLWDIKHALEGAGKETHHE